MQLFRFVAPDTGLYVFWQGVSEGVVQVGTHVINDFEHLLFTHSIDQDAGATLAVIVTRQIRLIKTVDDLGNIVQADLSAVLAGQQNNFSEVFAGEIAAQRSQWNRQGIGAQITTRKL